jgi:Uma2 family endonuclease
LAATAWLCDHRRRRDRAQSDKSWPVERGQDRWSDEFSRTTRYVMSAALPKPMTLAAFLVWEDRQELRFEFDGFAPVAMTGGTAAHDRITFNLQKVLDARLTGKPSQPWGPNMKIIVDGRARYPDAFVVCQPVPSTATVADNPVVVFEVVSEGTNSTDLIDKNREYRATPSIQRFVILQQTRVAAIVFARRRQDWLSEIVASPDAVLQLPEIDIELPLVAVYANVVTEEKPSTNFE